MLIVVHYCYRFLCTVVTDSCALLLPFFVHSPYHFLCTRDFCLHAFVCGRGLRLYPSAGRLKPVRPVSYGQAQDTLAGAVCLLHEQGGLQYAVYGLTCVRTYLTGL